MGGCGGPNNEYADIWMLNMEALPWSWVQMEVSLKAFFQRMAAVGNFLITAHPSLIFFGKVRGSEHRAKDIWSHPACKVGDKVVVLGKVGQA